jgi:hypothetical protein
MRLWTSIVLGSVMVAGGAAYAAEKPIKFWNLTAETISELYLAPTGTQNFGANQCLNDKDGTVETDEMVVVKDVSPGKYDLKLKDVSGRSCLVKSVTVKAHENFSLSEKQLKDCTK